MEASIGYKIKALRTQRGMSAAELGELIGLSGGAIYSYEKDKAEPPISVVEKLALALGATKEELMGLSSPSKLNFEIERLQEENAWLRKMVERLISNNQGALVVADEGGRKRI
ncbi:MAG: helix-turn-helix transcriptional regulator [Chitinophagales bacterium]|nr:helix-turn-helix transcriptional regulator [Chitinophagales bacterium]